MAARMMRPPEHIAGECMFRLTERHPTATACKLAVGTDDVMNGAGGKEEQTNV